MVDGFESKILTPQLLQEKLTTLPRPLVFTNGCFDILHRGHATYLDSARAMGQSLLVAVNSDASVRRLGKGKERPINPLDDRMALLAALASVSLVTWFEEDTPLSCILMCRPDILVKGGDWAVSDISGANEVQGWGGQVLSIPFLYQRSTSQILKKIRHAEAHVASDATSALAAPFYRAAE